MKGIEYLSYLYTYILKYIILYKLICRINNKKIRLMMGFPGGSDSKKNLPAVEETQVQSLGWEDPLEKEMATLSSILAWRIPWTEETGRLEGSQRVRHNGVTNMYT